MNLMLIPISFDRWKMRGLFLATLVLLFLRFFHLDADFPLGINRSGDLFYDEGWYANAAIRHFVYGKWYLDGDFNPIVSMPLGQLIHRMAFELFGLGFSSARVSGALAFAAVIVFIALLVQRHSGTWGGLLTALIIASYYPGFAFSRLAVMESLGLGLVSASLFVADRGRGPLAMPCLIAAALLLVAAALAKSTMIFAIPLLAYIAWLNAERPRDWTLFPLISLIISLTLIGGYQLIAAHQFSADYAFFKALNLGDRQVNGLLGWLVNIPRKVGRMFWFGGYAFCIGGLLVAAAGVLSAEFRRSTIVHILLGYGVAYFALQSLVWYGPARYFLPFIIPLAGLTAIATLELTRWLRENQRYRNFVLLPSLLVAIIVIAGSANIVSYMVNPKYSFRQMAEGVDEIIRRRGDKISDTIVFGNLADTTAITVGFRAMNTTLSTAPLNERLNRYRPPYVLLHEDHQLVLGAVHSLGGRTSPLGAWEVYENYYRTGQNVRLFSVDWSEAVAFPSSNP